MEPITTKWKKDRIKISQFITSGVVSLDCNHVEGFQKSEKLETLYGFGGRHLGIRDICMEFGRHLTAHSLVTMQCNITKLGKLTHFYAPFLVMGLIS